MDLSLLEDFLKHVTFHDVSFLIAVVTIIFNPLFWNVVRTSVLWYVLCFKCYCAKMIAGNSVS